MTQATIPARILLKRWEISLEDLHRICSMGYLDPIDMETGRYVDYGSVRADKGYFPASVCFSMTSVLRCEEEGVGVLRGGR